MKKLTIGIFMCFFYQFIQAQDNLIDHLKWEREVIIFNEKRSELVSIKECKMLNDSTIQIKGNLMADFEIENLMPKNLSVKSKKFNKILKIQDLYIKNYGGKDRQGNDIFVALCLPVALGNNTIIPKIDPFDYPSIIKK